MCVDLLVLPDGLFVLDSKKVAVDTLRPSCPRPLLLPPLWLSFEHVVYHLHLFSEWPGSSAAHCTAGPPRRLACRLPTAVSQHAGRARGQCCGTMTHQRKTRNHDICTPCVPTTQPTTPFVLPCALLTTQHSCCILARHSGQPRTTAPQPKNTPRTLEHAAKPAGVIPRPFPTSPSPRPRPPRPAPRNGLGL